jgi:hypothetical protein
MRNRPALLRIALLTMAVACGLAPLAQAEDKSPFNLFNPTPRALMRDLSTDRPDVTESAYTVDAGHVQVEMSLIEFTHDDDGGDFDQFTIAPSNIKVGLTNNIDVQLVLEPYIHQRFDDDNADGFGATQLRMKFNLFGNDQGDVALAVMPFVQFPTAEDDIGGGDHLEGGVIFPFTMPLPAEFTLSMMAEIDALRNDADDDYGLALVHTLSVGHAIAGELSGYVEYVGVANYELDEGYVATAGCGLTYLLREDVQLDSAVYFGISEAADDFSALLGLSFRM